MTGQRQPAGKLIVYGHDYCGQARAMARLLENYGIEHEWRDVVNGKPQYKDELLDLANGNLSVPTVVFPDGTVMVEPWPDEVLERLGEKEPGLLEKLATWLKK